MAVETAEIKKAGMPNTWIIGLVLIVLVLGGAGLYQMKQKNALQMKLDKKEGSKEGKSSNSSTSMGMGGSEEEEDSTSTSSTGSMS